MFRCCSCQSTATVLFTLRIPCYEEQQATVASVQSNRECSAPNNVVAFASSSLQAQMHALNKAQELLKCFVVQTELHRCMLLVSDFLFIQYEITDQVCWRQVPANFKKKPQNLNAKKHFGEKKITRVARRSSIWRCLKHSLCTSGTTKKGYVINSHTSLLFCLKYALILVFQKTKNCNAASKKTCEIRLWGRN